MMVCVPFQTQRLFLIYTEQRTYFYSFLVTQMVTFQILVKDNKCLHKTLTIPDISLASWLQHLLTKSVTNN